MNAIKGKRNVDERDKENIREMSDAGMDFHSIARITGWSYETVRRIARGVTYKKKANLNQKKAEEVQAQAVLEQTDSVYDGILDHVKNLNLLLFSVEQKLERICLALGVGD